MTLIHYYIIGVVSMCASVAISYIPWVRDSWYYLPVGGTTALVSALTWFSLAKAYPDRVFQNGAVWDFMVASAYLILPILFFKVPLTMQSGCGILLMLAGCLLLH